MQNLIENALYLVPTPIGNLEDISQRAISILSQADIVACEDTRQTGKLLKLIEVSAKQLTRYHDHNEKTKSKQLVVDILAGKSVALVSDAGSPAVSDPGYRLVQEAIENKVKIIALPGATAFVPALTASGMPSHSFAFLGFPPQKKGRKTFLEKVADMDITVVMYESPYRIIKIAKELAEVCGEDRQICFAREISKVYEEFIRGTIADCIKILEEKQSIKGEFVIVLHGK